MTINEIKRLVKAAYKEGYTQALNEDDNSPLGNEELQKRSIWPDMPPLIAPSTPYSPIRWDKDPLIGVPPITCTYSMA